MQSTAAQLAPRAAVNLHDWLRDVVFEKKALLSLGEVEVYEFKLFDDSFPECVAKGSRLTWESEGRAVFAGRCFRVRNRPHVFAIVRIRLLWPCRWGELEKMTFHGRVTCQFAPLFYCDLHKSGMSCKIGDAFRCTGEGFVKVTHLRRTYIGICSFRVVFWRC